MHYTTHQVVRLWGLPTGPGTALKSLKVTLVARDVWLVDAALLLSLLFNLCAHNTTI